MADLLPSIPARIGRQKRDMQKSTGRIICAQCPALAPCPPCAKGQMCQLSIPASCADCPVKTCVVDPNYLPPSNGNASTIGGALGGILAALALAGILYWFCRQRNLKVKEANKRARVEAKLRIADGEKFRPGGSKDSHAHAITIGSQSGDDVVSMTGSKNPFVDPGQTPKIRKSRRDDGGEDEEASDEDTEWTELREDGLTAYLKPPGGGDALIAPDTSAKRRSTGAATHLSRITEGAEEEDEGELQQRRIARQRQTIAEEKEEPTISSHDFGSRGHTSSASISSEGNKPRSRRSRGSGNLNFNNPFSDGADVASVLSLAASEVQSRSSVAGLETQKASFPPGQDVADLGWASISVEPPSPVHRVVGSPLVDFNGKSKPKVRSMTRPQIESPLTTLVHNTATLQPSRPARRPDLNLQLDDGTRPGANLSSFRDSETFLSPAAPSTSRSQQFDQRRSTREGSLSTNAALLDSNVLQKNTMSSDAKHFSSMTASSIGTLAYVLSSPKIVTPSDKDGVQRMQLKQGKAQLVRTVGAGQKEMDKEGKHRGKSCEAKVSNPQSADHSVVDMTMPDHNQDPFDDDKEVDTGAVQKLHSQEGNLGETMQQEGKRPPNLLPLLARHQGIGESTRPVSGASTGSFGLPIIDGSKRALRDPVDRSPTDATARDSMASNVSHNLSRPRQSVVYDEEEKGGDSIDGKKTSNGRITSSVSSLNRQSGSSIGGLSLFDDIPFQISDQQRQGDNIRSEAQLPGDALRKIQQAKQRSASEKHSVREHAVGNPLLHHSTSQQNLLRSASLEQEIMQANHSPLSSPVRTELAPASRHHDPLAALERDDADRLQVIDTKESSSSEEDQEEKKVEWSKKPTLLRSGIRADFDEIRLRHELDNYPFKGIEG